ncbi:hypothetical protein, partial [Siphonobacter sp. BAB-5385]|uniref:hypothetical protein n=1 Tax=Siphonobacter sp. BAB-5385 TaxID=1864822 RepID=UPI001C3DDA46
DLSTTNHSMGAIPWWRQPALAQRFAAIVGRSVAPWNGPAWKAQWRERFSSVDSSFSGLLIANGS